MVLCAVLAVTAAPADGAVRRGSGADGTRFFLNGKQVAVRLPDGVRRGWQVRVSCGSEVLGSRRIASARLPSTGKRRVRMRFATDVSRSAEWCFFDTSAYNVSSRGLPTDAAILRPRRIRPPRDLTSGPGVREAVTTDTDGKAFGGFEGQAGDAHFYLRGSVLTVRLRRAVRYARVVRLVCARGDTPETGAPVAYRSAVLPARRHTITADLGRDPGSNSGACLIEGTGINSGDIAAAAFPPR